MLLVSILSSAAIVFGIAANLPQIARMHRSRSAAGQSPVGWVMGAVTNLCLAYVNLVGLGATLLGIANLGTVVLCTLAVTLTVRLAEASGPQAAAPADGFVVSGGPAAAPGIASLVASAHDTMVDMPTQEFVLLHDAVRAAEQRRTAWRAEQRGAVVGGSDDQPELALAS